MLQRNPAVYHTPRTETRLQLAFSDVELKPFGINSVIAKDTHLSKAFLLMIFFHISHMSILFTTYKKKSMGQSDFIYPPI